MEISHPQTNGYTLPVESEHPGTSNWDQLNGYKVQYRKPTEPVLSPQKNEYQHGISNSCEPSPQKSKKDFVRMGTNLLFKIFWFLSYFLKKSVS